MLEAICFDNYTFDMHMFLSSMTLEHYVPFRQLLVTACPFAAHVICYCNSKSFQIYLLFPFVQLL